MLSKAIVFMGLLFGSFFVWLPNTLAGSTCCRNVKKELDLSYEKMCGCPGYKLQFQGGNAKDYVKVTGVPDMTAFTTCFWVNTKQSNGFPAIAYYAVRETYNAWLLYTKGGKPRLVVMPETLHGEMGFWFGKPPSVVTQETNNGVDQISAGSDFKINDGKWHHVCATWQSQDGNYSMYKDGSLEGEGTLTKTIGKTIPGGGILVLGQDQDTLGGKIQLVSAFAGEIAEVHIWDSVLSSAKILEMSKSCRPNILAQGNVKTWSQFESGIAGGVKKLKSTCCNLNN